MCYRRDLNGIEEDLLDEAVISLFRNWHEYTMHWLDDKDAQNFNLIDEFCLVVREAIISLQDTPELKELMSHTVQMENDNRI
jgi:hypothetical protein